MRRSPTIFAVLGVALAAMGPFAAVALAQVVPGAPRVPTVQILFQQPGTGALDAGLLTLDGGVGPFISAPYIARPFATAVNQTPTCTALGYGTGATVNLVVSILGSNDLATWVPLRDGGIVAVDAGFVFQPYTYFDMGSGFVFQEIQVQNVGSDGGYLTCTVGLGG